MAAACAACAEEEVEVAFECVAAVFVCACAVCGCGAAEEPPVLCCDWWPLAGWDDVDECDWWPLAVCEVLARLAELWPFWPLTVESWSWMSIM